MGDAIPLSRFKGVIGGESELPLCFATFAFKSRPARQGIMQKNHYMQKCYPCVFLRDEKKYAIILSIKKTGENQHGYDTGTFQRI